MKAYTNARIFDGEKFLNNFSVLTDNDKVVALVPENQLPADADISNLHNCYLAPAFIDIQIYGGNGKLFSNELSVDALHATRQYCMAGGASRFYITLATNSMDVFYRGIEAVRDYWAQGGSGMPGLHLEGPYLNPVKRGAHLEKYIRKPTVQEVKQLLDHGKDVIKIMTVAPECCDIEVLQLLHDRGIVLSAGHSNASYRQATKAFDWGIPAATHLFNAMSPLQHREPGLVGAIYEHDKVKTSIVPDGIHVDFAALRISKRLLQHRLFIITDAVTATNSGDYPHVFNGDRYNMPDGTLSGSALTMMKGVENVVKQAGIPLEEALRMASLYPAQVTGTDTVCGRIQPGYAAELVVFDDAFSVQQVITPR